MKIILDDGLNFGLGVFETIKLFKSKPMFLKQHLKRLENSLEHLEIINEEVKEKLNTEYIIKYIEDNKEKYFNYSRVNALKITVTKENIIFQLREAMYCLEDYEEGIKVNTSSVIRNETSFFVYHKTLNYGDNILEKRKAVKKGYDEVVFFNTRGELSEGAVSNVFLVKDKKIYTPMIKCGLLNGIIRQYIIEKYDCIETIINREDIKNYDEMFITNSLMGIMPVQSMDECEFKAKELTKKLIEEYNEELKKELLHF